MEGVSLGVRKGAWTEEEDNLLRKCSEQYGEGKWHQVPLRAFRGLNRCRKSCRLRWLNYLKPNIKKGNFTLDEVDLIVKLHKLLGNRWSLIAGRLPGRTANDVKNYWNTHMRKKSIAYGEETKAKAPKTFEAKVIKPQPLTFSKNLLSLKGKTVITDNIQTSDNFTKGFPTTPQGDDGTLWWNNKLADMEINNERMWPMCGSYEDPIIGCDDSAQGEKSDNWSDTFIDYFVDLWNLLDDE